MEQLFGLSGGGLRGMAGGCRGDTVEGFEGGALGDDFGEVHGGSGGSFSCYAVVLLVFVPHRYFLTSILVL